VRRTGAGNLERHISDTDLAFADPRALRHLQWTLLGPILAKAARLNPFYAERWLGSGVDLDRIQSIDDFALHVPLVRKRDFIQDQERKPPFGLRAAHALELGVPLRVFQTSGTSGQGQEVHLQTEAETRAVEKIYGNLYAWAGVKPGDHVFLCYPVSMLGGGQMDLLSLQAFGCTVYPVGTYDARHKVELIERYAPTAISGMPSYLMRLALVAGENAGLGSVRTLICSGEGSGYRELSLLGQRWNASVSVFYGATQLRADPLFTCERGIGTCSGEAVLHNSDPHFLMEVISPETGMHVEDGETGELVFTSLIHTDTPLIRCATGDGATYRAAGSCRCGRSFSGVELGSISRLDDMRRIKGVNVWPEAVHDTLAGLLDSHDYGIKLRRDAGGADVAVVEIFLGHGFPATEVADLRERVMAALRQRIGIGFAVEMKSGGHQPDTHRKRRWIDEGQ